MPLPNTCHIQEKLAPIVLDNQKHYLGNSRNAEMFNIQKHMKNFTTLLLLAILTLGYAHSFAQTVTDADGNVYNTVIIGTQQWTKENLKTTKFNDGSPIPLVTDGITWNNISTPAYCWYNNDQVNFGNTYGALYNWFAVDTSNLCPIGWHIPSDSEWTILSDYLGGSTLAGGKLKATTLWNAPNTGATNESEFTALPGGYRGGNGIFEQVGNMGMFWSASGTGFPFDAWLRGLNFDNTNFDRGTLAKFHGFSIRCLNDNAVGNDEHDGPWFEFQMYPNPSQGNVIVHCGKSREYRLQVLDVFGKTIVERPFVETTEIVIETKGVYFVRIFVDSEMVTKKLIIQ